MPSAFTPPYDLFVGKWTGVANVFDWDGHFIASQTAGSLIEIYWKDEAHTILSFAQFFMGRLAEVKAGRPSAAKKAVPTKGQVRSALSLVAFDLHIKGKAASGLDKDYVNRGVESSPGNYLFELKTTTGDTIYYNNQHFLDDNNRIIIGPQVTNGEVQYVISQNFTRVSF